MKTRTHKWLRIKNKRKEIFINKSVNENEITKINVKTSL